LGSSTTRAGFPADATAPAGSSPAARSSTGDRSSATTGIATSSLTVTTDTVLPGAVLMTGVSGAIGTAAISGAVGTAAAGNEILRVPRPLRTGRFFLCAGREQLCDALRDRLMTLAVGMKVVGAQPVGTSIEEIEGWNGEDPRIGESGLPDEAVP